jgi:hypothetical protein
LLTKSEQKIGQDAAKARRFFAPSFAYIVESEARMQLKQIFGLNFHKDQGATNLELVDD